MKMPVLPTGQHPQFDSIYAAGVAVQINPLETWGAKNWPSD